MRSLEQPVVGNSRARHLGEAKSPGLEGVIPGRSSDRTGDPYKPGVRDKGLASLSENGHLALVRWNGLKEAPLMPGETAPDEKPLRIRGNKPCIQLVARPWRPVAAAEAASP